MHPNSRRCTHVRVNGVRCGSPAMRGTDRCYFHQNVLDDITRPDAVPVLEDTESVQIALMQVMRGVANGQLDARRASLLLWGLQIASHNVRRARFEPSSPITKLPAHPAPVALPPEPQNQLDS